MMENDDLNIYDDVCDFDLGDEVHKLKTENELLRENIRTLEDDAEELKCTIGKLTENQDTLKTNISTLYLTAKAEIERKDRMISEFRTKYDSLCFKRVNHDNIANTREREGNASEVNIAKRIKYDNSTKNDSNDKHSEKITHNSVKKSEHNVSRLKRSECEGDKHGGYRSGSTSQGREGNTEDTTAKRYKRDVSNTRRNEFVDKYHGRDESRSRHSSDVYHKENRGRSRNREVNEIRKDDKGRRCDNKYRDKRSSDVNRRFESSSFSSRDSRGECSKTFERTRNIRETSASYSKDLMRSETYKKPKQDDKPKKISCKVESITEVSKDQTLNKSCRRHRTVSEKNDSTKIKPVKKRLKMLDEAEKKIKKLRATPIKADVGTSEPTLNSNRIKEVSRNISEEIDNEHRNNPKHFKAKVFEKEGSKNMKSSKERSSQHSIKDSTKQEDENITHINLSDDEKNSIQSEGQDIILIEEDSSELDADSAVNRKAREKAIRLSESLSDATIEDIKLTIKYHIAEEDLNRRPGSSEVYLEAEYTGSKRKELKEDLTNTTMQNIEKPLEKPDMCIVIKNLNVKSDVLNSAELRKQTSISSKQHLFEPTRHDVNRVMKADTEDKKRKQSQTRKLETKFEVSEAKENGSSFLKERLSESMKQYVKLGYENRITKEKTNDAHSRQQDDVVKDSSNAKSKENICEIGPSLNVDAEDTTQDTRRNTIEEKRGVNLGEELNLDMELVDENSKNHKEKEAKKHSASSPDEHLSANAKPDMAIGNHVEEKKNVEHFQLQNESQVEGCSNVILDEKDIIKNKKNDTKKKIQIHSNIELTPTIIQESIKEEIKNVHQSKLQNVNEDADYEKMEGEEKLKSPSDENVQGIIKEDGNGNLFKKQDLNIVEKSLNVNIENEEIKTEEEANIAKQVVKDHVEDETKNYISKRDVISVEISDTKLNSHAVDREKETKEKINNAATDVTDITKPDITVTMEKITSSSKEDIIIITNQDMNLVMEENVGVDNNSDWFIKRRRRGNVIEKSLNVNSCFSSTTKGDEKETNKNLSKEDLTNTKQNISLANEEVKNVKHSNQDINRIGKSLNVDLNTRNAVKDDKETIFEKMKSLFGEDSMDTTKHDISLVLDKKLEEKFKQDISRDAKCLATNLPITTKRIKPTTENLITSEEMGSVAHSEKQNISMGDNTSHVDLDTEDTTRDRKREMKNVKSVLKEALSNNTKQADNLVTEEDIKYACQFKTHVISKIKSPLKDTTKQDKTNIVVSENQDKTVNEKPLIDGTSYEKKVSGENKRRFPKKYLPNIKKAIEDNIKKGREKGNHDIKRINESTNISLTPENSTDKDGTKGTEKLSKKLNNSTNLVVNLDRNVKENKIGNFKHEEGNFKDMKRSSKDLANTSHGNSSEKKDTKHSKMQEINRQFPIENQDTRTTSKDDLINSAGPEMEDSGKGDKNTEKYSKEVVESENTPKEEITEKQAGNIAHKSRRDKKVDANKAYGGKTNPEFSSCEMKKEELQSTQSRDKTRAIKETETITSKNVQKSKEDSKESTGTTSSEEIVHLKVMKFSDMQGILRQSIESAANSAATTKNTKLESDNRTHDKCSTGEPKINEGAKVSRIRISESARVRKPKEYISDSSASADTRESGTNLINEKLNAFIQNYINKANVDDPKHSVAKSNKCITKKEIMNIGEDINVTSESRIGNVNREKQTVAENCDRIVNKDLISINTSPKTNDQAISSGNCRTTDLVSKSNVQTTVNKNATPDKPPTRRRITPTPVKSNVPICSFKNILEKSCEPSFPQVSPLHLTHEGEIPVLHLEENHINNLPTETHINDKNIISLLDTMNISNMECDIPKISCDTVANLEANSGDSNVNVSPIKGNSSLTFKDIITKVTSTPLPKTKCQNNESNIKSSGNDATPGVRNVGDSFILNKTSSTEVQGSANSTFRRRRRRCRLVIVD